MVGKISEMTAASALTGVEQVEVVQSGATRRTTTGDIAALAPQKYCGLYTTLAALNAAVPTASAGDYADVDSGSGSNVKRYIWDASDTAWVEQTGGGAGMTNPMTTAGDMIYGGAAGVPTRLPPGSSTQVMTMVGGAPAWATPVAIGTTQTVASAAGVLNLTTTTAPVILVTLTENITSITLPAGVANQSIERRIKFTQGGAGTYTVAGWPGTMVVEGGATAPVAATGVGAVTEYFVANDNNTVYRMYLDAVSDLFAPLATAEVSVTGATTLTITAFGKMHVCSGTSADYTVGLPAASGNAGKFIGFRMSAALTKLATLDGNASELIDGVATKVMWAKEAAVLFCDGAGWIPIIVKNAPFRATAIKTANQTVGGAVFTKITFDAEDYDFGEAFDLPNSRFVCKRAGLYSIAANITFSFTTNGDNGSFRIYKNGAQIRYPAYATTAISTAAGMAGAAQLPLVAGDVVECYVYNGALTARDVVGNATAGTGVFSIMEVPAP